MALLLSSSRMQGRKWYAEAGGKTRLRAIAPASSHRAQVAVSRPCWDGMATASLTRPEETFNPRARLISRSPLYMRAGCPLALPALAVRAGQGRARNRAARGRQDVLRSKRSLAGRISGPVAGPTARRRLTTPEGAQLSVGAIGGGSCGTRPVAEQVARDMPRSGRNRDLPGPVAGRSTR